MDWRTPLSYNRKASFSEPPPQPRSEAPAALSVGKGASAPLPLLLVLLLLLLLLRCISAHALRRRSASTLVASVSTGPAAAACACAGAAATGTAAVKKGVGRWLAALGGICEVAAACHQSGGPPKWDGSGWRRDDGDGSGDDARLPVGTNVWQSPLPQELPA